MKTEISVEELVTEVTLLLSNAFISEIKHSGLQVFSEKDVLDLYVRALHNTAKAYQSEVNNKSRLH